MSQPDNRKRVAIISGLRTPFARSGTIYSGLTPLDLGKIAVTELVNRTEIDPADVGALVFGSVMPSVRTPNIARDVALGSGIPDRVPAFTVSSSCASSVQAITNAVDSILSGAADAV
ncbi:MAG: acetyl-CoA C-acyltransferase, partial [Candidatus Dadabacteria bacterium]|nr:acetyl-CoA C-acyltransferase [Candidatus Dadabacteria bacterium]